MRVLILGISGLLGQNGIWVLTPWPSIDNIIRGKVVGSPKFALCWVPPNLGRAKFPKFGLCWVPPNPGRGDSRASMFAHSSSVHQKCFSYALTNLLFDLCKSMWLIDLLVNLPSPHLRVLARPSTLEMLQTQECTPTPSPFVVSTFGLIIESIKELGGVSIIIFYFKTIIFSSSSSFD